MTSTLRTTSVPAMCQTSRIPQPARSRQHANPASASALVALPLLVLAVLEHGECYGYDLSRQLEGAGLGEVKGGTLYPVLARLERDGLVAIRWSEPAAGPARKYYRLTPAGRTQLHGGAAAWTRFAGRAMAMLEPVAEEAHDGTG